MSQLLTMPNDWAKAIEPYINTQDLHELFVNIQFEYKTQSILPNKEDVFNSLDKTPYEHVKVVILGQDPYPTKGHAMGLSFSVPKDVAIARSLDNIFKERESDLGIPVTKNGDLTHWAKQGVLLLNTTLTVKEGLPFSHKNIGWEHVTIPIIKSLNDRDEPIAFILWGRKAQDFSQYIDKSKHHILTSSHPSPLGATKTNQPFIGSKVFSKTNELVKQSYGTTIDWNND